MVAYVLFKYIKFLILYQLICYDNKFKAFAVESILESSCIGKHQMGLETSETNLSLVDEQLQPLEFTDFDKIPNESILERKSHLIMIHLKYNDTEPTINWLERVPKALNSENLTFPGELHAIFYNKNAKSFEHALTTHKGLLSLAFGVEINPLQPLNFDILQGNLKQVQDPFSKTEIENRPLKYWLNSDMKHFYVYEGSLMEFYCKATVIWIDFIDRVVMSPEIVKEFEELRDNDMKPIMREFPETLKPKGKVFAFKLMDGENNSGTSTETPELVTEQLIPDGSIVLVDGIKPFNSAFILSSISISMHFLITFGHLNV